MVFLPFSLIKCMVNMDVRTICLDDWVNRDELKTSWLSQIMLYSLILWPNILKTEDLNTIISLYLSISSPT